MLTKIDEVNGRVSAQAMELAIGQPHKFEGAMFYEDDVLNKETGEMSTKELVALKLDNTMYASPSPSLIKAIKAIIEILGDEGYSLNIFKATSKSGREFLTAEVVE